MAANETDDHWAITLYQRYVALYGEPIEQPLQDDPSQSPRSAVTERPGATPPGPPPS
jgi:hypothetical protein